jgi:DNA-binding XRE family transcriptional regulator
MLTKLVEIQIRNSWTDAQMAQHLHVARSTWTEVRNGRLALSERVQMAAARSFPELLGELLGQVREPVQAQEAR